VGQTGGETSTILSLATAIEPAWLTISEDLKRDARCSTTRPHDVYMPRNTCDSGAGAECVIGRRRPEAARLLAEEVLAGRLKLNEWDHGVEQWISA
jgi:ATP-dependent helicase HrpB